MFKKMSSLINYILWLYKQNQESQKNENSIFRIVNINKDETGDNVVTVQVINKSTIFKCGIEEIVSNDLLLECFSKKDIRTLTYIATEEVLKPKNK